MTDPAHAGRMLFVNIPVVDLERPASAHGSVSAALRL
jgi:hypothetical protein